MKMGRALLVAIVLALLLSTAACCDLPEGGYAGAYYVSPTEAPPTGVRGPLAGTVLYGIDVSAYQGTIDWTSVKAVKDFAIMRATFGVGYRDAQLTNNQTGARNSGILHGYYHFAYPNYGNAAIDEADWMLSQIGTLQPGEVLCLDYEVSYSDPVNWCYAFLNRIYSRTGVKPFLYINLSTLNGYNWSIVKNAGYPLWLAYPDGNSNPAVPSTSWGTTTMKQYSWTGSVSGISGDVDLDVFNGDASAFLAYGGLTDTTAPVISGVAATGVVSSGATVTWATDDASTSRVDYGLTSSYGSSTTEDTNLVTGHSVPVTGLSAGTTYHYRVKSTNATGLTSYSGDYTFTTSTIPTGCPQNGDMESGFSGSSPTQIPNGWTKMSDDGTSTYTQDTSIKHGGTSSQKIQDPSGGQAYTGYVYQKVNVVPNRAYVLRYYSYRASGGFVIGMGVDVNGGTSFSGAGESSGTGGSWVLKETPAPFTSGSGGLITIGYRGGCNGGESVGWIDDITIAPAKPPSSGGTATICAGQTATLTASGGFGGNSSELHWYTGAAGTGTHVGAGTTLIVTPTATTTYYPRWESASTCGGCCTSSDGPAVTVTVLAAAPTVTAITPSSGPNTGTTSVTNLAGAGFVSGASVKLTRSGYSDVAAAGVSVTSPTKITCTLDLTGKKTGLWNVVVTNPDAQSGTLANGFGVTISASKNIVGTTVGSLLDAVAAQGVLNYRFRVWGSVETIDGSTFWLNDGSKSRIKVFAPGYTGITTGGFASAVGTVDLSPATPVLVSSAGQVKAY
jgi:GH25 family lysozyme M1 (1,4-beta-N-acetylmuramidase)